MKEIYANQNTNDEQVKELKRQIMSLQTQLDIERARAERLSGGCLLNSVEIDLYPGEQLDFLLSILRQVKDRCPIGSRPYDIIDSLLSVNEPVGRGEEILDKLEKIFKRGMPENEADLAELRSLGFRYTQSRKHPKLRFHETYTFVLPCTTGDKGRSAKNCLAEISKCIALSQKV